MKTATPLQHTPKIMQMSMEDFDEITLRLDQEYVIARLMTELLRDNNVHCLELEAALLLSERHATDLEDIREHLLEATKKAEQLADASGRGAQ